MNDSTKKIEKKKNKQDSWYNNYSERVKRFQKLMGYACVFDSRMCQRPKSFGVDFNKHIVKKLNAKKCESSKANCNDET